MMNALTANWACLFLHLEFLNAIVFENSPKPKFLKLQPTVALFIHVITIREFTFMHPQFMSNGDSSKKLIKHLY